MCMAYADAATPGKAVQVDPIKSTLTPRGTKRLKLTYYKLLSNVALKFHLRRCTPARLRPRRRRRPHTW